MKSVLVVDDDPNMREGLRDILEDAGYTVDAYETGAEAVQRLREHPVDIALLDYKLPDGTGAEWAGRLRAIRQDLRIFLLTGFAAGELPDAAGAGFDGVLTKPIAPQNLLKRLAEPA